MNSAAPQTRPSAIEAEVGRIRDLLERRQVVAAGQAAQALIGRVPHNRDAMYLLALAQRHLRRIPEALATLERLQSLHPQFSRLYQERGHCYVTERDAPAAIAAFERAVTLNPALPSSWNMLEGLYRMSGRPGEADRAAARSAALLRLPAQLVQASSYLSDGEIAPAEHILRTFMREGGEHAEAMRLLARIAAARGAREQAARLLAAALERAPQCHDARFDYARLLLEGQEYLEARAQLDHLLEIEPTHREYRALYATVCAGLGHYERALGLYRELLAETPGSPELHLSVGHVLKTVGRTAEASESYRAAAAGRPDYGDAYWSLANLKTYRFTDGELTRMSAAEAAPAVGAVDRLHLCFALGKALEDRADYTGSYEYYARGNALRHAAGDYCAETLEREARLQIEVCTPELLVARTGVASDAPIFIVGLPRSGSTLVEQILASHPEVDATHELAEVPRIVERLRGSEASDDPTRYPRVLRELACEEYRRLGEGYLAASRVYRGDRSRFTDKMPNNFRHLGLIHLMLPNARIIDVRREPMACCFGNFKQLFASGQEFSYCLEDIARYYRTYLELMRHWERVLPGRILRVHYEDLVEDLPANVRRVLAFCALPFDSACLRFHQTARGVRTASSEQVRLPIYRDGLEHWKHYARWLAPLREALGDAGQRYREAVPAHPGGG